MTVSKQSFPFVDPGRQPAGQLLLLPKSIDVDVGLHCDLLSRRTRRHLVLC